MMEIQVTADIEGYRHAGAALTVDIDAVRWNYRLLRRKLKTGVRCASVLKADAYGLGAHKIGPALELEGCRHFFVAHVDEGLRLQPYISQSSIYVLNGLPRGSELECARAGLIPVLNSLEQFSAWSECARKLSKTLPTVIQIDSGMNRFGWSSREIAGWVKAGSRADGIDIRLVMSHLACADAPCRSANEVQLNKFRGASQHFPGVLRSLANSSGIFLGNDYHHDLVRPGAALYGINPVPSRPNPMHPVVRLTAQVAQLREADKGDWVGYGGDYRVIQPTRLATLSIGYADGLHRALQARGRVYFEGQELRIAGRVSMDCIVGGRDVGSIRPSLARL
jgi:alanine racemase